MKNVWFKDIGISPKRWLWNSKSNYEIRQKPQSQAVQRCLRDNPAHHGSVYGENQVESMERHN